MSESIITGASGRAVPVRGDDIDTDRIIPARFLRCVSFEGLGEHAFEDDRKNFSDGTHPFDREEFQGASILVVNDNFGCGSSREHAPQSLMRWGIKGLVGVSFAEIFFGNCVANGIPCLTLGAAEVEEIQGMVEKDPGSLLELAVAERTVRVGEKEYPAGLPDGVQRAFLEGLWDSTTLLLEDVEAIARVSKRLLPLRERA
jgi:3-isopropylmalate/(R)-2-methylmalate dehydratase small subunit